MHNNLELFNEEKEDLKIKAFNELAKMDFDIKNDIDDKEEIYNALYNKYDGIN